jgi:threonine/homoserine/homoserine lactone efflux protein
MQAFSLSGAVLGLTAAVAPGVLQLFLISQSLAGGWRRDVPVVFAILVVFSGILFKQGLMG